MFIFNFVKRYLLINLKLLKKKKFQDNEIFEVQSFLNSTFFSTNDLVGYYYTILLSRQNLRILQSNDDNNLSFSAVKTCENYFDIIGGNDFFVNSSLMITKIFENLPSHHSLNFKIRVFKFITSSFYNTIKISLSNQDIFEINPENFGEPTENFCGIFFLSISFKYFLFF